MPDCLHTSASRPIREAPGPPPVARVQQKPHVNRKDQRHKEKTMRDIASWLAGKDCDSVSDLETESSSDSDHCSDSKANSSEASSRPPPVSGCIPNPSSSDRPHHVKASDPKALPASAGTADPTAAGAPQVRRLLVPAQFPHQEVNLVLNKVRAMLPMSDHWARVDGVDPNLVWTELYPVVELIQMENWDYAIDSVNFPVCLLDGHNKKLHWALKELERALDPVAMGQIQWAICLALKAIWMQRNDNLPSDAEGDENEAENDGDGSDRHDENVEVLGFNPDPRNVSDVRSEAETMNIMIDEWYATMDHDTQFDHKSNSSSDSEQD